MATRWKYTVNIGRGFTDESRPFVEVRDEVVATLRAAIPTLPTGEDEYFGFSEWENLADLVDCMAAATDPDDFDYFWEAVYNYGDSCGVWIDTFSEPVEA